MSKELKLRRTTINCYCVIITWLLSLIVLINVISYIQVYTKKCEDKLMNDFYSYTQEILESEVKNYE